jgi:broad specificity phosphatase PhoE
MHDELPVIYLARHGAKARSVIGQHTALDLPLTAQGEERARSPREPLGDIVFSMVLTSLLPRADHVRAVRFHFSSRGRQRSGQVGLRKYEGLRSTWIHAVRLAWDLFRDGLPGGGNPRPGGRTRG